MKRNTYRVLCRIPIIGPALQAYTEPLARYGSMERESGAADETRALISVHLKTQPDEQVPPAVIQQAMGRAAEKF